MKHFKFRKRSITLIWILCLSVMLFACVQKDESPPMEVSLVSGEDFVWMPQFLEAILQSCMEIYISENT